MKQTLILLALGASVTLLTPHALLAQSNTMYEQLQKSDKPFADKVVQSGSGCTDCTSGCGSSVRKNTAEIQISVIMPMIFQLDLTPEQTTAIQTHIQTLQPSSNTSPEDLDTKRLEIMRAAIAVLNPQQRNTLLQQLVQLQFVRRTP
jgi:hypothetical protein